MLIITNDHALPSKGTLLLHGLRLEVKIKFQQLRAITVNYSTVILEAL